MYISRIVRYYNNKYYCFENNSILIKLPVMIQSINKKRKKNVQKKGTSCQAYVVDSYLNKTRDKNKKKKMLRKKLFTCAVMNE